MTDSEREALLNELPKIAEVVNKFNSEAVQARVFEVLLSGLGGGTLAATAPEQSKTAKRRSAKKATDGGKKKKATRSSALSIVKDLDLRPADQRSFGDFAKDKAPRYANEQSLVAVWWLGEHGGVDKISTNHIYTAFRDQGWKVPSNLVNHLQVVASTKGWLDTKDSDDIKVTVQGENYVLHDLPPKAKP